MQNITVRHNDGTTSSASITPSVQVAFERHFKCGVTVVSDVETLRLEHIYWLAWQATTVGRQGRPEFDVWLDTVAEIDHGAGEAEPSPLAGTQPSGGSLPSPSSPALG